MTDSSAATRNAPVAERIEAILDSIRPAIRADGGDIELVGFDELEAVAIEGIGVFDTVKTILKACLKIVGDPVTAPEGRSPSILPGKRASMFPSAPGLAGEDLFGDAESSREVFEPSARESLSGDFPLPPPANTPSFEPEE